MPKPAFAVAKDDDLKVLRALAAGMAERDMLLRRLLIEVGNDDVLSQTASHRLPGCNLALRV